ncbi:MAG: tripartite tricarboxylate transporter substrate binding protein [Burkholderiaceae bacterium]
MPEPSSFAIRRRTALAGLGVGLAWRAHAQASFPNRPLTLVVPFAPGGIADLTARAVAEPMARALGQSVVVDNRPSAGSIVASQFVAQSRPDGHTLLMVTNSHALSVSLFRRLPYDTLRDFAPVGLIGSFDLGLFVPANSRFASLGDALAFARAQPGRLTIATIAVGSTQHLAAELFKTQAGIDALVVPYKTSPAVVSALRSGDADLAFEIVGPMLGQVSGGALRALAVTGSERHASLPSVPTVQQAGVARYAVSSWNALAVPSGTPPAAIERLNRALREATAGADVRARLAQLGLRLRTGEPQELHDLLASEIARWREVIRAAKIEPE